MGKILVTMQPIDMAPWEHPDADKWLTSIESWPRMVKLIYKTLEQEPRRYPHEIRAAASLVIMLCRNGLWPQGVEIPTVEKTVALARRQLSQVKHQFSIQARINPELIRDRSYRTLLDSLDEELRILESRISDVETDHPQQPPCSWTEFWSASPTE